MVQIPVASCTCNPCNSVNFELTLRDFVSFDKTPCSIQICWNKSARECCSPHNALFLQWFVEHEPWFKVKQDQLSTFLWWKLLGNHSVYFPTQTGTTEFQLATFTIQAQNMKINQLGINICLIATSSTSSGRHLVQWDKHRALPASLKHVETLAITKVDIHVEVGGYFWIKTSPTCMSYSQYVSGHLCAVRYFIIIIS